MAFPLPQQYLQIQIQDDLKNDIRIENADLDRYFCFSLDLKAVFAEVCTAASFTERMIEAIF
jgi:hypothetical protein